MIPFLLVVLCCVVTSTAVAGEPKRVVVTDSGGFRVLIDGKQWFSSSTVFFRAEGKLFSTADTSLLYVGGAVSASRDALGTYEKHSLQWRSACGQFNFFGNILEYTDFIVFEQEYPSALWGTSSGDADSVISAFPSFDLTNEENKQGNGFAQWVSWFYPDAVDSDNIDKRRALVAPGFDSPLLGRWNDVSANISGGMGGSGVLCVFEAGAVKNRAVVVAPLNNFMSASHKFYSEDGSLSYGVMGNVTDIPTGFSLKTLMFIGTGINGVMSDWGRLMRGYYEKDDATAASKKDITLQYLGFTTDNGAYYYYNTAPGMDYQDTMDAIKLYADSVKIPYHYVLLDSWFYYRGSNDGVKEWNAMPDVFPGGVQGVHESTGWLVQAHNRYWAPDVVYAKNNNGTYDFIIDLENDGAVPIDESFWGNLLETPASTWGLRVYEQDWLFNEVLYVKEMMTSTSLARKWLMQMGEGAAKHDLTIQYCMPYVRHLLQSLEVSSVTQARASDDYKPSEDSGQWRIAGQNILLNALGLAPSKDGVYSSSVQDGNPYGISEGAVLEPYPRLQSVVAALSAGPIALADGINYSDRGLIMRSCMEDGRLLVPSKPAMTIDQVFQYEALGTAGISGEVWLASSSVSERDVFYLFAAEVAKEYAVYPVDLDLDVSQSFFAFESGDTSKVVEFSSTAPLKLYQSDEGSFVLWTIVAVESNGMCLQGEIDKWISVSDARFDLIDVASDTEMVVEVFGVVNETVSIGFGDSSMNQIIVVCTFRKSKLSSNAPTNSTYGVNVENASMRISSSGQCIST